MSIKPGFTRWILRRSEGVVVSSAPTTGRCCYFDFSENIDICVENTEEQCDALGDSINCTYYPCSSWTLGESCEPGCTGGGGCCDGQNCSDGERMCLNFPSYTTDILGDPSLEDYCVALGGEWLGVGNWCGEENLCGGSPCGKGACCVEAGNCQWPKFKSECDTLSGTWYEGKTCGDIEPACDSIGSCCEEIEPPGTFRCSESFTELDCQDVGGEWTLNGTCPDDDCSDTGACCDTTTNSCTVTHEYQCVSPNEYKGDGTNCDGGICDPPIATELCCWQDSCMALPEDLCTSTFINGTVVNSCANCDPDTNFSGDVYCCEAEVCWLMDDEDTCEGSSVVECSDCNEDGNPGGGLGDVGACCINNECFETYWLPCTSFGGDWFGGDSSCNDESVTCPNGACCTEDGCLPGVGEGYCTNIVGGIFAGHDTACPSACEASTVVGACCVSATDCSQQTIYNCVLMGGNAWHVAQDCGAVSCFD